MTTNKPEVIEVYRTRHGTLENMVLLADYEALQAEYRILESELATVKKVAYGNVDLLDECEKLRKDAERYRWLRAAHTAHPINLTICSVTDWDLEPWSGDDPDAAIDAAMEKNK